MTCVRSTTEVKPQRPTVPFSTFVPAPFYGRSLTPDSTGTSPAEAVWQSKPRRADWDLLFIISLLCVTSPSPVLSTQIRVRLQLKDLSILTTSEHNFCLKSGLDEYSPPPEPQNYPNLLLHRKFNFLKPLC